MALRGISLHEHNRLLDKLTRRTDNPAATKASYRNLVELYSQYGKLISELEAVITKYYKASEPVRARQMNTGRKGKMAETLNQ